MNFIKRKRQLTKEEEFVNNLWVEESKGFPKYINKLFFKPSFWILVSISFIIFRIAMAVGFDFDLIHTAAFYKLLALDLWNDVSKYLLVIFIVLLGIRFYRRFLKIQKDVDKHFNILNKKSPEISKAVFSRNAKIIIWIFSFVIAIPSFIGFIKTFIFVSGWSMYVQAFFEIFMTLFQILRIHMVFLFAYIMFQISKYFKSLSGRIDWKDIWLIARKKDPSGGFFPIGNLILNLCLTISMISVAFMLNELIRLLVDNNVINIFDLLTILFQNDKFLGIYYIFFNYIIYLLIPIIGFLVLLLIPEITIHKKLDDYTTNHLDKFHKFKTDIIIKHPDIKPDCFSPDELIELQRCNFVIIEVEKISLWTIDYRNMWNIISIATTIIPILITVIKFLLDVS